jgi:hypothetical protein
MNNEEKDKGKRLPWLFRMAPPPVDALRADLDPADAVYRLFSNTRNPFLKRALAPPTGRLDRSPVELQALFRWLEEERRYRVAPPNADTPYRRRRLEHAAPPAPPSPRFQEPRALPGGSLRLPAMIADYFRSVLGRLRSDPDAFFDAIDEMTDLFRRNRVKVRVPEAFRDLEDWDHLLETLEEISHYPASETFDLFCGALLAYHELVEPEQP